MDEEIYFGSMQRSQKRLNVSEASENEENGESHNQKKKCDSDNAFNVVVGDEIHEYFGELSLKNINKKSQNDVWKYFGLVQKNNQLILSLEKKILCRQCFEKRCWKRHVHTMIIPFENVVYLLLLNAKRLNLYRFCSL